MSATTWYIARSSGIVAYLLLSSSVVLGALMAGRTKFVWPRFAVEEVHRFLALLAGVFIVVHGSALLLDTVVPIALKQELVPFSSAYRPFAVALGVLAAELMAAVGITNLFRARLPHTVWRRAHYLTLGARDAARAPGGNRPLRSLVCCDRRSDGLLGGDGDVHALLAASRGRIGFTASSRAHPGGHDVHRSREDPQRRRRRPPRYG
jgi:methionine sulfoxide reductase heme-binding subunit